ncbi:MAG: DUF5684 domain-containing protein [Acutalibacteraceae bacterium]|nr:hypothetical protein [Clostridia bacterium]MEE3449592.1 DUF5684 domain-containing protein [Acutalibacteraceae bacterium]
MYDTDYYYQYTTQSSSGNAFTNFLSFAMTVILIISYWKMFQKAGEQGWKAIVPLYNSYTLTSLVFKSGWYFLIMLIPVANIVFYIMMVFRLAKAYGRSTAFGFGMLFLPYVFFPIVGFDKTSQYLGNPAYGIVGNYGGGSFITGGQVPQGYSDNYYQNLQNNPYNPDNVYGQDNTANQAQNFQAQGGYTQKTDDFIGQNNYGQDVSNAAQNPTYNNSNPYNNF